jgi:cytochrome c peroxidase
MKMNRYIIVALISVICLASCVKDKMPELIELDMQLQSLIRQVPAARGNLDYYVIPDADDLSNIPQDVKNPLNPAKVELGKLLFFETGFSRNAVKPEGMATYSCGSCHIPSAGFKPGYFQGIADGGEGFGINGEDRRRSPDYIDSELDVQSARPLTMINVAYVSNTFWNGSFGANGVNVGTEHLWNEEEGTHLNALGFEAIETQNMEGLHVHRITYTEDLINQFGYKELFDEAFPDLTEEERYSNFGGSLALSAYIRTILATEAPFQKWLKGDNDALGYEEKQGGILFFGKANCSACHYKENLGSIEFHALGVNDMDQIPSYNTSASDKRNLGRGGFTNLVQDYYKFKVPGLYNVSDTPFYFHGASVRSLEDLVEYKNLALSENERVDQSLISEKFLPLNLNEEEKKHLVAFLRNGLQDPDLERYMPSEVLSGNCIPNNDLESKNDLGCN